MIEKPVFICLTPVKNEAWILESFIQCNSLWANYIIILDQLSSDNTKEICDKYQNVIWVENDSLVFNEDERQLKLIAEARKLPGDKKILIALDADEVLSSNARHSKEWIEIKDLPKGTVIKFPWFNINQDKETGWFTKQKVPFGFVDDGSEHMPQKIHSTRIPVPTDAPIFETSEIVNLHFQYIDPVRNQKKQRWYMCWERINFPDKHPIDIYRQYNKHFAISALDLTPIPHEWIDDFGKTGEQIFNSKASELTWWDIDILTMFENHDTKKFRKLDIWDVDWITLNCRLNIVKDLIIDRSWTNRSIISWLKYSQKNNSKLHNRLIQRLLKFIW